MSLNQTGSDPSNASVIKYLDGLYSYARILVRNPTDAENLVQETYTQAHESMGRPQASVGKLWLFTVLRDLWLSRHYDPQTIEVKNRRDPGREIAALSGSSLDPYARKSETEHLRMAIQELSTEFRELVFLREYEGLSTQEIAVILNCPVESVMPQLSKARGKLRTALAALNTPTSLEGKKQNGEVSGASPLLFFSRTRLAPRTVN